MLRCAAQVVICALLAAGCASATPKAATPEKAPAKSPAAPPQAEVEDAPPETVFAVRFHPGPKWLAGKAPFDQPGIMQHVQNMGAWDAAGKLLCGGPFLDSSGGLAVLRTATVEEAKKMAEADPCVVAGLMTTEVHPWMLAYATGIAAKAADAASSSGK